MYRYQHGNNDKSIGRISVKAIEVSQVPQAFFQHFIFFAAWRLSEVSEYYKLCFNMLVHIFFPKVYFKNNVILNGLQIID